MSKTWRKVSALAEELGKTETQTYRQLADLGVIVFKGVYHHDTYSNSTGEPQRGMSTMVGLGAVNAVFKRIGVDIRQDLSGNMLNVRHGDNRTTLWVYHNHGAPSHTFACRRGFMRDSRPEYYMFMSSPDNVAYVHRRSDMIAYFTGKKKLPEHVTIPEGWEEWDYGCLTFKFMEGQPEQLKTASQLGF